VWLRYIDRYDDESIIHQNPHDSTFLLSFLSAASQKLRYSH